MAELTDLVAKETNEVSPLDIPNERFEILFQLSVTLWTGSPADGDVERTAITRSSGVLEIDPTELNFCTAYICTPR